MGAYEAGYLYMLTELAKRNPRLFRPEVITGASAGTINALLTAISLGSAPEDDPQASMFYKAWTELHHDKLFDVRNKETPPGALSSRAALRELEELIRQRWMEGLHGDFSIVVGASATRLFSRPVKINDELSIPRQTEKFVFEIVGQGPGQPPSLYNHLYTKPGTEQILLPFTEDQEKNLQSVMKLVFASSGFPLVFAPQPVDYCSLPVTEGLNKLQCRSVLTDQFIDGGVFDNHPLLLAYQLSLSGPQATQEEFGRVEQTTVPADTPRSSPLFLYLDPTHSSYPARNLSRELVPREPSQLERADDLRPGMDLFETLPRFVRSFIGSARSSELYALVQENPAVGERLQLTTVELPPMGSNMGGMFGFMDREFMKHDFYLGMHDAHEYLERIVFPHLDEVHQVAPEDIRLPGEDGPQESWRPFRCMREVIEGDERFQGACAPAEGDASEEEEDSSEEIACEGGVISVPPDMRELRIVLQTSIERLYQHCSRMDPDATTDHRLCEKAMAGEDPVEVPGVEDQPREGKWKKGKGESELDHVVRLLTAHRFHFGDIGLSAFTARQAPGKLQATLKKLVSGYAATYRGHETVRFLDRSLLRAVGKPAVTTLGYRPARHIIYLTLGRGSELAWSQNWWGLPYLRANWSVAEIQGFTTWTAANRAISLTTALGPEYELRWLSSPRKQVTLGLRFGFQVSTDEVFQEAHCAEDEDNGFFKCAAPAAQVFASYAVYSRIRLQGGVECYSRRSAELPPEGPYNCNIMAAAGWQFLPDLW